MQVLAADGVEALVLRTRIGDRELEGVDVLRFGADGLITDLTGILRPLSGVVAPARVIVPKAEAAAEGGGVSVAPLLTGGSGLLDRRSNTKRRR